MSQRVTIRSDIALATKQVAGQLETKYFTGLCLSPEAVCVYVCVHAAKAAFRLRHIVCYSKQHSTFYPASTAHTPQWQRRGICVVYSHYLGTSQKIRFNTLMQNTDKL